LSHDHDRDRDRDRDHHLDHRPRPLELSPTPLARSRLAHSNISAVNDLDPRPQWVIPPNASRSGITFHNPGLGPVVVFPEYVLDRGKNRRLEPTVTRLGGGFILQPGATLFISEATAQQGWQALALHGNRNPLTIQEQSGVSG
jgi:hypothetical protein